MMKAVLETCTRTATERRNAVRYRYEMFGSAALYVILVFASVETVDRFRGIEKYAVAVMPALGALLMAAAMIRFGMRMDELQRRTFVDAAVISLVFTAVVTMALGFLENAGIPRLSMIWVWPIAVVSWGAALPFVRRRYA